MAKPIMIQGTMSNAGKSFFAAGLCRIFMQEGYKCAPFKSQNMALNSYITADGYEIGRAQAMQAEAAGAEPSVLMNPVLLKPTTDVGSQVIVNGRPLGNMTASEYFRNKKQLIPQIKNAYDKLSAENDIIVIEGAGSPVELNLLSDDIVNMGMAKIAESPVILVGDIDRGGIFPQLLGTLDLLLPMKGLWSKDLLSTNSVVIYRCLKAVLPYLNSVAELTYWVLYRISAVISRMRTAFRSSLKKTSRV